MAVRNGLLLQSLCLVALASNVGKGCELKRGEVTASTEERRNIHLHMKERTAVHGRGQTERLRPITSSDGKVLATLYGELRSPLEKYCLKSCFGIVAGYSKGYFNGQPVENEDSYCC